MLKRVSSTYLPERYEIRLNQLKPRDSRRESSFAEAVINYYCCIGILQANSAALGILKEESRKSLLTSPFKSYFKLWPSVSHNRPNIVLWVARNFSQIIYCHHSFYPETVWAQKEWRKTGSKICSVTQKTVKKVMRFCCRNHVLCTSFLFLIFSLNKKIK